MSKTSSPIYGGDPTCVHHWLVEPADMAIGGIMGAACLNCGGTRTYTTRLTQDQYTGHRILAQTARDKELAEERMR